jgi:hypothetical protein
MKVFISWSGERSAKVADALMDWLPKVLQGVEPWQSRHSIDKGARWSLEIAGALEGTSVGIACLTPVLVFRSIDQACGVCFRTIDQGRNEIFRSLTRAA